MPAKLKYGVTGAGGGARKNAGRKPDWFKQLCQDELKRDKAKAIRIIGEIARGEYEYQRPFNDEGTIIYAKVLPTPIEIKAAAEFLRDSGFGKPAQAVSLTAGDGADIGVIIAATSKARAERGLDG